MIHMRGAIYLAVTGLVAASLLASCGGGESDSDSAEAPQTSATEPEGPASQAAETCDGNIINGECEASTLQSGEEVGPPECIELRRDLKEGACVDGTQRFVVVNRNSTVRLPELSARIVGIETTDVISDLGTVTRPNGVFLIFTLEVENRLSAPVEFDTDGQTLYTAGRGGKGVEFTPDSNATFEHPDSFVRQGEEIQPGTAQVGTVVFDVSQEGVGELEKTGNLYLWNFSDATVSAKRAKLPVGTFRTYAD